MNDLVPRFVRRARRALAMMLQAVVGVALSALDTAGLLWLVSLATVPLPARMVLLLGGSIGAAVGVLLLPRMLAAPVGAREFLAWYGASLVQLKVAIALGIIAGLRVWLWTEDPLFSPLSGFLAYRCGGVLIAALFDDEPDDEAGGGLTTLSRALGEARVLRRIRRGPMPAAETPWSRAMRRMQGVTRLSLEAMRARRRWRA